MEKSLEGKRALITGGVRGLGHAFALALASQGANLVVTSRSLDDESDSAVMELSAHGVKAYAIACDVTSGEQVQTTADEAVARLGGIDVLVNNAGIFEAAPLEELMPEQWDRMYATNTRGPFLMAKAVLSSLRQSHGRIVNIGSLGGLKPWTTHGHYCASKAALHMLTQTMARAWAPEVSVNCVAPGMIVRPGGGARLAEKTPMARDGSPADVASAVLYFATAPSFVTGQILAVDGGLSLV